MKILKQSKKKKKKVKLIGLFICLLKPREVAVKQVTIVAIFLMVGDS